jgi:NAD(P)-dependent dehydrogenase (short-subunit alcohol dehydrogenase family)
MKTRVAVIAGGAGGIGRAVVERLCEERFLVVILDLNEVAGQEVLETVKKSGGQGIFLALNLTKRSEIHNAFCYILSNFGRIDVLVNLAGGTLHAKLIQDFSFDEWREVLDVNLKATFLCCQAVIGVMSTQKSGVIVNTSSNYGITGSVKRTAYSASKAAIISFTKSLALELAPFRIRVNTIAPGSTATPRVMSRHSAESWAKIGESIPMARVAEPKDVAEGVAFLVSERSSYITGQTLHVNGGLVMP